ncbi:hypothetical protein Tco_0538369 [Tanacetum coccineum]
MNGGQKICPRYRKISEQQKLWDKAEVITMLLVTLDDQGTSKMVVIKIPSGELNQGTPLERDDTMLSLMLTRMVQCKEGKEIGKRLRFGSKD